MTTDAGDAVEAALMLLASRGPGATICPSEVARSLGDANAADITGEWRALMPAVHAAVDQLVTERRIRLSWKGRILSKRAGPYRMAEIHDKEPTVDGGRDPVRTGPGGL